MKTKTHQIVASVMYECYLCGWHCVCLNQLPSSVISVQPGESAISRVKTFSRNSQNAP